MISDDTLAGMLVAMRSAERTKLLQEVEQLDQTLMDRVLRYIRFCCTAASVGMGPVSVLCCVAVPVSLGASHWEQNCWGRCCWRGCQLELLLLVLLLLLLLLPCSTSKCLLLP